MTDVNIRPLAPLKELPFLDEEPVDAPLFEGEIVVRPVGAPAQLTLYFASVWEPFLFVDGVRLISHENARHRHTFMWLGRHLPVLFRALEDHRVLHGEVTDAGVVVVDVATLEDRIFLDHAQVRRALGTGVFQFAPFALLGPIASKNDLMQRLRGMYATGSRVEVRREDTGRVLGRRVVKVGRGD
jgi:hypothetical protein